MKKELEKTEGTEKRKGMTPDAINTAIAELCGWKDMQRSLPSMGARLVGWHADNGESTGRPIPNYCGSLDDMALAEATLTDDQFYQYYHELTSDIFLAREIRQKRRAVLATAAQRAEAFLRVHRKWEEWS